MSKLSFQLGFRSVELQSLDLPVDVRKPNLKLVAQSFSSQQVEVAPGTYFVSTTLPAGQELYTEVEVGETGAVALLVPDVQDESSHESHEMQRFMSSATSGSSVGFLEGMGGETIDASLGLLQGPDPKTAIRVGFPAVAFEKIEEGFQFRMPGGAFDAPNFSSCCVPEDRRATSPCLSVQARQAWWLSSASRLYPRTNSRWMCTSKMARPICCSSGSAEGTSGKPRKL